MSSEDARQWIIGSSLMLTTAVFFFLILAPYVFNYPLDPVQGDIQRIAQIVLPVFMGYLGSASHFVFRRGKSASPELLSANAAMLVRWPIIIFTILTVTALFAFWLANRSVDAGGMSVDALAWALTGAMGLLAVTTGVAVSYLFTLDKQLT